MLGYVRHERRVFPIRAIIGLCTAAAAPLANEGRFGLLFATAAVVAVPLGLFAALARRRYAGHQA